MSGAVEGKVRKSDASSCQVASDPVATIVLAVHWLSPRRQRTAPVLDVPRGCYLCPPSRRTCRVYRSGYNLLLHGRPDVRGGPLLLFRHGCISVGALLGASFLTWPSPSQSFFSSTYSLQPSFGKSSCDHQAHALLLSLTAPPSSYHPLMQHVRVFSPVACGCTGRPHANHCPTYHVLRIHGTQEQNGGCSVNISNCT